jgi:hypothetical protein
MYDYTFGVRKDKAASVSIEDCGDKDPAVVIVSVDSLVLTAWSSSESSVGWRLVTPLSDDEHAAAVKGSRA